jgi:hypothetical protein
MNECIASARGISSWLALSRISCTSPSLVRCDADGEYIHFRARMQCTKVEHCIVSNSTDNTRSYILLLTRLSLLSKRVWVATGKKSYCKVLLPMRKCRIGIVTLFCRRRDITHRLRVAAGGWPAFLAPSLDL